MTALIVVLLYIGTTLSMIFLTREQKRRELLLKERIEQLSYEIEGVKKHDVASMEKVQKINRMATELLCVLQEKEDDIQDLLKKVDKKRHDTRPFERPKVSVNSKKGLSASELHTIEMLRKRRLG